MISLKEVSKKYIEDFFTIFNFSFDFDCNTLIIANDFEAVCLFRLISKIDRPTYGQIFIDNKNIDSIKDKDLNIAYITEKPILFENKNIYKNLMYPLKLRKFNKNQAKNIIFNMQSTINLQNFNKKVKFLTLSQKKIISLARAILWQPKYILLENFFENLSSEYHPLAIKLLKNLPNNSIIIASQKENKTVKFFNTFKTIKIENGNLIK